MVSSYGWQVHCRDNRHGNVMTQNPILSFDVCVCSIMQSLVDILTSLPVDVGSPLLANGVQVAASVQVSGHTCFSLVQCVWNSFSIRQSTIQHPSASLLDTMDKVSPTH